MLTLTIVRTKHIRKSLVLTVISLALASIINVNLTTSDLLFVNYVCPRTDYTFSSGSTFQANLNYTLLTALPANASLTRFSTFAIGEGIDRLNALYSCRDDLSNEDCHSCVQAAAMNILQRCKQMKEGMVWYRECTLRYANRTIFSIEEEYPIIVYHNNSRPSVLSDYYLDPYNHTFESTMNGLVDLAAYNGKGFAAAEVELPPSLSPSRSQQTLRGLVKCSPDIVGSSCDRCLRVALKQRDNWSNTGIFLPSCYYWYDIHVVQSAPSTPPSPPPGPPPGILKIVLPVAVVVVVILCILAVVDKRVRRRLCCCFSEESQNGVVPEVDTPPPDNNGVKHQQVFQEFSKEDLHKATSGFGMLQSIGGFSMVLKGNLNGRDVAVKWFRWPNGNAEQEKESFEKEREIVSTLPTHGNVLQSYGYCDDEEIKMIVYEYAINGTLHYYLHERKEGCEQKPPPWNRRMTIATGVARGIHHLHRCSVIHRDIKPLNILLDEKFEPKVGDFDLAKHIPDNPKASHEQGTRDYIDPTCKPSGTFTYKSDVFSYGIVLLELITGRKSSFMNPDGTKKIKLKDWAISTIRAAQYDDEASTSQTEHQGDHVLNIKEHKDDVATARGKQQIIESHDAPNHGDNISSSGRIKYGDLLQNLEVEYDDNDMRRMVLCAVACVQFSQECRPTIEQVLTFLQGNDATVLKEYDAARNYIGDSFQRMMSS